MSNHRVQPPRRRSRTLLAGVATSTLLAATAFGALGAAPSYADGDPVLPTVSVTSSVVPGQGTVLVVTADSDSDIADTDVTVQMVPTGPPGDPIPVSVTRVGTSDEWDSDPLTITDYGHYDVTAEATDADGDVGDSSTYDLDFEPVTQVSDISADPAALDYADPTVTLTGNLSRLDPITGNVDPWVGQQVDLVGHAANDTTNSSGDFSIAYSPSVSAVAAGGGSLDLHLALDADGSALGSTSVTTTVSDTRITLDALTGVIDPGDAYDVTGTAEYDDNGTWTPLDGAHVGVDGADQTTTGADGTFTLHRTAPQTETTLTVELDRADTTGGAFLAAADDQVTVSPRQNIILPTVSVASSPGDPGVLVVTASSDTAITSVTAHLVPQTTHGGAVNITITQHSGHVWTSDRLPLTDFDSYTVTAEATDADNDVGDTTTPYVLDFEPVTRVSNVQASPGNLDYAHPDVTVTGTLSRLDPRSGDIDPWTDQVVQLSGQAVSNRTDSDGLFTLVYSPSATDVTSGAGALLLPVVLADHNTLLAVAHATTTSSDTRIQASNVAGPLDPGQSYSVSGTAQVKVGTSWVGLPFAHVQVDAQHTAVANGNGAFTITGLAAPEGPGSVTVSLVLTGTPGAAYLGTSSTVVSVSARRTAALTWSGQSIDEASKVDASGHLTTSLGGVSGGTVYLEQSSNGNTGWARVGSVSTTSGGSITIALPVPHPKGYWRLTTDATATATAATSSVWKGARGEARITGFNATPEPVAKGATITVVGTAQKQTDGVWSGLGAKYIAYYFRAHGSSTYTYVGFSKSAASGHFRMTFKASKDGSWSAIWYTTSAHYVNAYSSQDYVDVQ